jgi:hypothetical protein
MTNKRGGSRFVATWQLGAFAAFAVALQVGTVAILIGLPITILTDMAGADLDRVLRWLGYSALVWAPWATGLAIKRLLNEHYARERVAAELTAPPPRP